MNKKEFEKQIVIVTGGSSGIGRETAKLFAENGAIVVIVDINKIEALSVVNEIKVFGGDARFYEMDVGNAKEYEKFINHIKKEYIHINILFNNAGITRRADVIDTSVEEWDKVMNTNAKSVFLMSKHIIPLMKKNGGGNIVNTASGWGLTGGSKAVSYCASKGAVVLLTKAMAVDHGKDNIRVNCICPGDTQTNMLKFEAQELGEKVENLIEQGKLRPLNRIGQPKEIAESVLFLSSSKSSFITGESLVVDGGSLAGSI